MSINLSIKYCIFYGHDPKKYRRKMISSYIFLIYNEKQETKAKKPAALSDSREIFDCLNQTLTVSSVPM